MYIFFYQIKLLFLYGIVTTNYFMVVIYYDRYVEK